MEQNATPASAGRAWKHTRNKDQWRRVREKAERKQSICSIFAVIVGSANSLNILKLLWFTVIKIKTY